MSSYTDNPQALGNFNPYIQQLPVDAMVKVGQIKQEQYNEGIQKIQSNIDNIAGLDVIRDVDKQYLQTQLNQLGTKLKTVAAGDFSNYQLVNSVGGMVNQIGKDDNIINAVGSTAKYKRSLGDMEKAKQDGKSSPSNEWVFNSEANQWLNNTDVKSRFNGEYSPYTDYKKNALTVIKSLTKDESITDDAFTIDKEGKLVIGDALVRKKLAGIAPEKVQQALLAGLSPADFKQMGIDGRYNYSNVSPEQFITSINNSYKSKIDYYSQQKQALEAAKLQTQSNVEKNKLNDNISSLDKTIEGIKKEYGSVSSGFANGDVESAKAKLETINFMNDFSKAFSFTESSQTYENNPFAEMQMKREEHAQDWKKFMLNYQQQDRQFNANYDLKLKELDESKLANSLKKKELEGYGGLPMPVDKKDIPKYTLNRVVGDIQAANQQLQASDVDFLNKWGKDNKWLEDQRAAWAKRPNDVDPLIAKHFNETENTRRNLESNVIMLGQINKQAEQKFGDVYSLIPKDAQTWDYSSPQGNFQYSPRDIVDFNNKFKSYVEFKGSAGAGGGGGSTIYNDEAASKDLSKKELVLYNIYKKNNQGKPLSKAERVLVDDSKFYNKNINAPYNQKLQEINNFTSQEVTNRLTGSQGMSYSIPTGKPEQRRDFGTLLTSVAKKAEDMGGLANSPDFNVEDARKLAVDNSSNATITVVEGTSIQPSMYEVNVIGDKGIKTTFRLTPEEKNSVFGSRFESSPEIQALAPYQEQINKMGGYSTATLKGPSSHNNSFLGNIDFPSVGVYGIRANLVNSGGQYSIRLSVYDPSTKTWHDDIPYPRTGLMNKDRVVGTMRNLNDSAIYELLHDRIPSPQDIKKLQQNSKQP